jgi:transketolase
MNIDFTKIKESADTLRYLTLMAVERPASGHPGLPLGNADLGILLYNYFLRGTGNNPKWLARDRFVLSAGHGSMLLYGLGYLYNYGYTMKDIASFRSVGSKTPGHPELETQHGLETTTGPLGQGFANAVGIAAEAKMLGARFNKPDFELFNYNVFTLMGDGCTMEGVTNEAASMAGHLGLDNMLAIYDDNNISIDGHVDITMTENVQGRYEALGWIVARANGSDVAAVAAAIEKLLAAKGKPKLLIMKTEIGEGLNKLRGSHKIHGAAAGLDEIAYFVKNSTFWKTFKTRHGLADGADIEAIKAKLSEELKSGDFTPVDPGLTSFLGERAGKNDKLVKTWNDQLAAYEKKYPTEAALLKKMSHFELSADLKKELLDFVSEPDATRKISSAALQICAKHLPQLVGGSADLVGSTFATVKDSAYIQKNDFTGRNIAFGIREHAMGAVGNGLALNGTFIPFTSTFFTFFDYMKPAVRLAAIMKLKHLFVFTHDSIYVGEDGPTHQPIEHLGSMRLIPGIYTFRPANDMETGFAYLYFMERQGPVAVLGTRQVLDAALFKLPGDRKAHYENFKKGAYVMFDCEGKPDFILAGSGSEISTLYQTKLLLEKQGKKVRLVSVPCLELFDEMDRAYQNSIFPEDSTPIYFAEAASHRGFRSLYHNNFITKVMTTFGESGSYKGVAKHFGFDSEQMANTLLNLKK